MLKTFGLMITAVVLGVTGGAFVVTSHDILATAPEVTGPQMVPVAMAALPENDTVAQPALPAAVMHTSAAPVLPEATLTDDRLPALATPVLAATPALAPAPEVAQAARFAPLPRPANLGGAPEAPLAARLSSQNTRDLAHDHDSTPGLAQPMPYVSPYVAETAPPATVLPAGSVAQADLGTPEVRRMPVGAVDFNPWKTGVYR